MITLIAAIGENNELGKDNQLLWHLPEDLKHFKKVTLYSPMIMGRKTFESLPGVLPKRPHIVLTRDTQYTVENEAVTLAQSLDQALTDAMKMSDSVYVIGGGNLYQQTLKMADFLEITRVFTQKEADTYFPNWDPNDFQMIYREYHPSNELHKYPFEFQTFERVK